MPEYMFVDQPDTLCDELSKHDRLGVDTEFMREKTFFAELCLIQIAAGESIHCVDPLAGSPMLAFWKSFMRPTWILHSGRQDIEVVYQAAKYMPESIFDTQVAAGLLGYAPQMGYANLVKELFDVEIPKAHTRADWTRRPLSDDYLHYAAEDVEYLLPACDILTERLDKQDRLTWAREDSALLLNPALYDINPELAIARLKGARNFNGDRRAAATRLAAWRETEALRANRPRQWIAKDTVLTDLAKAMPATMAELEKIDGLQAGLVRRVGRDILAAITASAADGSDYRPPEPPDEEQKSLLLSMQKQVADCAADLGLAAETLASKRDLSAVIIGGSRESRVLSGWRRELIGEQLLTLL
jgi:ribonuclease D